MVITPYQVATVWVINISLQLCDNFSFWVKTISMQFCEVLVWVTTNSLHFHEVLVIPWVKTIVVYSHIPTRNALRQLISIYERECLYNRQFSDNRNVTGGSWTVTGCILRQDLSEKPSRRCNSISSLHTRYFWISIFWFWFLCTIYMGRCLNISRRYANHPELTYYSTPFIIRNT